MPMGSDSLRSKNIDSQSVEKQIKKEANDLPDLDEAESEIDNLPEIDDEGNDVDNLPDVDDEADEAESLLDTDEKDDEIDELPKSDDEGSDIDDLPDVDDSDSTDTSSKTDIEKNAEEHELTEEEKLDKVNKYLNGELSFEDVKEILAEYYAKAVNTNKPWTWGDSVPGGDNLTAKQKKEIRECAREKGLVPTVPVREENGKTYADFSEFVVFETVLDEEYWDKTDKEQFSKCNEALKKAIEDNPELAKQFTKEQLKQIMNGETPDGYTWHHSEKDGTMQLVPFGIHNSTNHHGGRSEGEWADAPRT